MKLDVWKSVKLINSGIIKEFASIAIRIVRCVMGQNLLIVLEVVKMMSFGIMIVVICVTLDAY